MDTLQNTPFVCFSSQSIIEVYQQLESKPITSETHSTKFAQEWIKQLFNHHVVVSNYLNGGVVQLRTIHPRLTIIYLGPGSNPLPLVNIQIVGKWMLVPLKMASIIYSMVYISY